MLYFALYFCIVEISLEGTAPSDLFNRDDCHMATKIGKTFYIFLHVSAPVFTVPYIYCGGDGRRENFYVHMHIFHIKGPISQVQLTMTFG